MCFGEERREPTVGRRAQTNLDERWGRRNRWRNWCLQKKKNSDSKCQLIKKKKTSRAEKRDSEMHFSLAQGKNDNIWRQTAEIETLQATKPRLRAPNRLRRVNYLGRSVIHSDTGFLLITDRTGTSPDACSFLHLLCLFFSLPITFSFAFPKKLPCMQVHPDQRCQLRVITLLLLWVFFFWLPLPCGCAFTDDLLGKRRSFSPNTSSECPTDSKKPRSASPKGRALICLHVCLLHCWN